MRLAVATFISATLAALASAYTTPVGDNPSGNPISKPALNEIVPVNQAYNVTWNATTPGTVTLVLLRGPSENIIPLYAIVEKIPNTGSFLWTPSSSLQADTTHYGIQLIDDQTGAYQYTSQFGVSNPSSTSGVTSATGVVTILSDGQPQGPGSTVPGAGATSSGVAPVSIPTLSTSTASVSLSSATTYTTLTGTAPLSTFIASTGGAVPAPNSSFVRPTISLSVPASLLTSTTTGGSSSAAAAASATSVSTGAGGRVVRNMAGVLAGLGAMVVFVL